MASYGPGKASVNFGLSSCLAWTGSLSIGWAGANGQGAGQFFSWVLGKMPSAGTALSDGKSFRSPDQMVQAQNSENDERA